jgi:DNA-binding transcriptional ArsR family regulator
MNKVNIYKALSSEERLKLLKCLSKPQSVGELLNHCSLTQSALSQHLKVLRDAGLVDTQKEGKNVVYRVKTKKVSSVVKLLLEF